MSVHTISRLFRSRLVGMFALLLVIGGIALHCRRNPTPSECRHALRNRINLLNKDNREARDNALREVDRLAQLCVSGMKRESVLCDIKARNVEELNRCR